MDSSRQGCRLRLGEDVERGADLEIAFAPAIGGDLPTVEVQARVIWCRVEGLSYQAGVQFQDAPEELETLLSGLC